LDGPLLVVARAGVAERRAASGARALVCACGFPVRAPFLAGSFEEALSGHIHLSHSGQVCAEASAAIVAVMAVNPASTRNRPALVIASS
jgi:hypothetical protein